MLKLSGHQIADHLLVTLGRLAVRLGQTERLLRLMGTVINSPRMKKRAFAGYTPTASDIFVATYSKSGTNWAMQIAQQIAYYGDAEFENIHDLVPWPDTPLPFVKATLDDTTIAARAPTGLRVIKTHWERPFVPFSRDADYLVVIRDPKEVVVSGFYFAQDIFSRLALQPSIEQWIDLFESDRYLFGSWAEHTASWWPYRNFENVLLLNFAEMKRTPRRAIEQVAALMEVLLTQEQLDRVEEKSSFAYMKAHSERFTPTIAPTVQPTLIRSGQSGRSSELLSPAQQARIDAFCAAELRRLGSDFPYAESFVPTQTAA